jgi:hypothetical protein
MPPGYSRPVLMINAGVKAYSAGSNPTPVIIKGCQHLSEISGDVEWTSGVTAGKFVADIIPRADFPNNQDGEIIFSSDIVADSITTPSSQHFVYPGNAAYIRHRIVTDVTGGSLTSYHNGYTNR